VTVQEQSQAAATERTEQGASGTADEGPELKKSLKSRHMTMISLGGVIGAGLFVGSSAVIRTTGPAAVLSYWVKTRAERQTAAVPAGAS
jgi:amino acid permease